MGSHHSAILPLAVDDVLVFFYSKKQVSLIGEQNPRIMKQRELDHILHTNPTLRLSTKTIKNQKVDLELLPDNFLSTQEQQRQAHPQKTSLGTVRLPREITKFISARAVKPHLVILGLPDEWPKGCTCRSAQEICPLTKTPSSRSTR